VAERQEPTTALDVAAWIEETTAARDRFRHVAKASVAHRQEHGCDVYPGHEAPLFGVLVAAVHARRILEVGCGLGYSALWLAFGSSPGGLVDTVEKEEEHCGLAQDIFERESLDQRIRIVQGEWPVVATELHPPYDVVAYDATIPTADDLERFAGLLAPGGLLISSNLFLGQYAPDLPGLERGAGYRRALLSDERWLTAFASEKAISVLRSDGRQSAGTAI
jgi:predicted O-methyltransferase YrrM